MTQPLSDENLLEISTAIFEGRKIEAIKLYREATDAGLKEAKEQVDALEASLRKDHPEKFVGKGKGSGCGGAAMLAVAVLLLCGFVFL